VTDPSAGVGGARILDRGYRRYDGPRRGVPGAVRSLAVSSALRALGLRRTLWAKVFPLLSAGIAYVPAVVFVGVAVLLPQNVLDEADVQPEYQDYYGFITAAIVVFVALVGPEVLCPDRRNGMLGLYLASPLTRGTYLVAKVLAVVPVLAIVTVGPPLLLLIGLSFAESGPDGVAGFLGILARILVSGLAISAAYTAVSLGAASLTDRRAVASAVVILVLLVSSVTATTLVELGGDVRLQLLNLFFVPFELVQRIYGTRGVEPELTTAALVVANVGWTAAGGGLVWWRYQKLTVTR
jgi:ABC-2 type transport system permease protein